MKRFATGLLWCFASFVSFVSFASSASPAHAQAPATPPAAQHQQAIEQATEAAGKWLALVDAGQYKASWEAAAAPLRNAVGLAQWEQGGRAARMPVGALQERKLASSTYTTSLPGVPQGQYVVLQYASRFADRANAVETVTPMLEADGTWRVMGYYIR